MKDSKPLAPMHGALPGTLSAHMAGSRRRLEKLGKWFRCPELENGAPAALGMDMDSFGFELCGECTMLFMRRVHETAEVMQKTLMGELPTGLWRGLSLPGQKE